MLSMVIPPVRTNRTDEEGDVEPGGVVPHYAPGDAFGHHPRRALGGYQPGDPEEEFHEISGADHSGIEGAQQH
jgi:hypothetical protein